jgi:hypothetical protein
MRTAALLLLTLGAALCCGGCGSSSPSSPSPDILVISTLSPAAGTRLAPGSSVTFVGRVDYSLHSGGSATVSLVIEDQNGRVLDPGNQATSVVPGGQGSVQLTAPVFLVPASGVSEVQVVFVLTPNIGTPTPTDALAAYPVG